METSLFNVTESVDAKLGEMSEKSEITFTNLNELIDLSKQEMSVMKENAFTMQQQNLETAQSVAETL